MVAYYEIFGQKIGSHILAIGTLSTMFVGTWAMAGGKKSPVSTTPPINASSKDEENFIQQFLKEADSSEKKH